MRSWYILTIMPAATRPKWGLIVWWLNHHKLVYHQGLVAPSASELTPTTVIFLFCLTLIVVRLAVYQDTYAISDHLQLEYDGLGPKLNVPQCPCHHCTDFESKPLQVNVEQTKYSQVKERSPALEKFHCQAWKRMWSIYSMKYSIKGSSSCQYFCKSWWILDVISEYIRR